MNTDMTKETLLAKLNAKLKEAKAFDKKQATKHRAECRTWEAATVKSLGHASKLRGKELQDFVTGIHGYSKRDETLPTPPSCPVSQAFRYEEAIATIEADRRSNFVIDTDGRGSKNSWLASLLMWEADPKPRSVCVDERA